MDPEWVSDSCCSLNPYTLSFPLAGGIVLLMSVNRGISACESNILTNGSWHLYALTFITNEAFSAHKYWPVGFSTVVHESSSVFFSNRVWSILVVMTDIRAASIRYKIKIRKLKIEGCVFTSHNAHDLALWLTQNNIFGVKLGYTMPPTIRSKILKELCLRKNATYPRRLFKNTQINKSIYKEPNNARNVLKTKIKFAPTPPTPQRSKRSKC